MKLLSGNRNTVKMIQPVFLRVLNLLKNQNLKKHSFKPVSCPASQCPFAKRFRESS